MTNGVGHLHQSYTTDALRREGPRITVEISATAEDVKEGTRLGFEYPPFRTSALIDTGATFTIINPEVAERCKLRHTSFTDVACGDKIKRSSEYAARIGFPGTSLREFSVTRVVAYKILQISAQPYDCLIGRDILSRWKLSYSGAGTVDITEL